MGIGGSYYLDGGRTWNLLDRRMPILTKALGNLRCIPESFIFAPEQISFNKEVERYQRFSGELYWRTSAL